MIGPVISHYKILEKLGEGGMGVVYKAQDTKLDRIVALKFLPHHLTASEAEQARFLQEAKAAAVLNHPNVCVIHSIEEAEDKQFIVMEYVDGVTLREKILRRGEVTSPLQVDVAVSYAIQIGEALHEAHSKGIVHRDIKCENIMVNSRNQIKVMDFGLAKLKGSLKLTKASSTVGTLAYMAPEQIQGGEVDSRSDIFSFGVVLFEMLTGRLPFRGEHDAAMMYSILNEEPEPLAKYLPETGSELLHLINRALEKDPAERYQNVADMLIDLRRARKDSGRVSRKTLTQIPVQHGDVPTAASNTGNASRTEVRPQVGMMTGRRKWLAAALVVVAIATFITLRMDRESPPPSVSTMRMTRLTNEGTAGFASISPDGKYVVYAKGERGEVSLWIRQVASSADVMVIPPSDVVIEGSTFSHDGNYLYYTASLPDAPVPTVYRIPVIGGTAPRKIIGDVYGAVALSPDDKRLAFLRGFPTGEEALFVANADGSQERMLTKRDGQNLFYLTRGASPAWSPDGSVIVCPDGSTSDGFKIGFVAVSADDPQERLIMKRTFEDVGRVVWYPNGRGLLFCGSEEGKPLQIMYMSYPARTVSRITNDLLEYGPHSLSVTQDGSVIVSAQTSASATVMIAPDGDGSRIREITKGMTRTDGMTGIAWTNDQRIIYSTTRGVTGSLWTSRTDGGDGTQLTFVPSSNPAVSMATGDVYYVAAPDGALPNIWRMKSTGADPVRLTSAEEYNPDVSLDGQWVVFDSWQSGARGVWKMRTDNSEPATIFLPRATTPRISPDGKFVACRAYDEAEKRERMAIVSFSEGNVVARFDLPLTAGTFHWAPDGKGIHYVDTRKGVSNIWMIDYRNNSTKQISTFTSGRIFSFAWSPDGKQLAVSRGQATSDVVMLTMNE